MQPRKPVLGTGANYTKIGCSCVGDFVKSYQRSVGPVGEQNRVVANLNVILMFLDPKYGIMYCVERTYR